MLKIQFVNNVNFRKAPRKQTGQYRTESVCMEKRITILSTCTLTVDIVVFLIELNEARIAYLSMFLYLTDLAPNNSENKMATLIFPSAERQGLEC